MRVKVKAPGSCGELVQGTIDGKNFLITCPIDMYSEVEVISGRGVQSSAGSKALSAVAKTMHYLKVADSDFQVAIQSSLPSGKGMASSSADISATCQAVALRLGKMLTTDEIADLALSIEPTDGVFYPGIVMFDHVHGLIRRYLGTPPKMYVAVFDVGGEVDTLYFNRRTDLVKLNSDKEHQVRKAMDLVIKGLATGNTTLIGQGATLSAVANQNILCKPCLDRILDVIPQFGAVGLNAAHSGTVLGVLFPTDYKSRHEECITAVQEVCPEVKYLRTVKLISGGLMKQEGDADEWKTCI